MSRPLKLLAMAATATLVMFAFALTANAQAVPEGAEDNSTPKADSAEALLREMATADMETAIREGLEYLASQMSKDEGAIGSASYRIATTALSGMAFLASGSLPQSGPYSDHIKKTVAYLLRNQDANTGYFTNAEDGCRIHGHGYATMYLAQVYGHWPDSAELRRPIERAVRLMEAGQTKDGGWGYVPDDTTWDEGSTTICVLQALRSAQSAGIRVSNTCIANALGYLEKIAKERTVTTADGKVVRAYTFMYSLSSGYDSSSWALVAASCACLNNIGVYSANARWNQRNLGRILEGGMAWLRHRQGDFLGRYKRGESALDTGHFHYANFYAAQACWQYSDISYFRAYFPDMREQLIAERRMSGTKGWAGRNMGDTALTSAFALLTLLVPYQYLPAFQR